MMEWTAIESGSAGVLAPGRWRRLRALAWMLALFVVVVAISALPVSAVIASVLCYLAYARAVSRGERRAPGEIASRALPRDLAIGLLIGLGMFTIVFASLRLIGVYTLAPGHWDDWPNDILQASLTGFVEELVFRAIVFRLLVTALGVWPALGLSALIFGGLHLANPHATLFAGIAIAIEAGLMLASFYLLTGRIWMSVGVHLAWNFAQGSIFGARVSGGAESGSLFVSAPVPGSADMISGGAFGPEASLSAIIVGFGVFLAVLAAARRRDALA